MACGASAVKLEGGVSMIPQVRAIIAAGIPFVGHIGMLPQSVKEEGGYKKKGKTADQKQIADQTKLFAVGGKHKVGGALRDEVQMGLCALHEPLPPKTTRPDSDHALDDVKTLA